MLGLLENQTTSAGTRSKIVQDQGNGMHILPYRRISQVTHPRESSMNLLPVPVDATMRDTNICPKMGEAGEDSMFISESLGHEVNQDLVWSQADEPFSAESTKSPLRPSFRYNVVIIGMQRIPRRRRNVVGKYGWADDVGGELSSGMCLFACYRSSESSVHPPKPKKLWRLQAYF